MMIRAAQVCHPDGRVHVHEPPAQSGAGGLVGRRHRVPLPLPAVRPPAGHPRPRPLPLPPRPQGHRRHPRRGPVGPLRHGNSRPVHHPPPHQEPRHHQAPCHLLLPPLLQEIQGRPGLEARQHQASLTVIDLVYEIPELKDHMAPVRGPMEPQKVLPMGFGYASFRPRRHVKKRRGPALASVVAGLYLQKKMLPSSASSDHSEGLSCESLIKAKEWLVDLVDESLEVGKQSEEDLPQSAPNKGAPVIPVLQANIATLKRPVSDNKLFRKAQEWAVYLIDERLEAWPVKGPDYPPPFPCKDGDLVAPVLQTMPESLTSPAENSTTTSVREGVVPGYLLPWTPNELVHRYM